MSKYDAPAFAPRRIYEFVRDHRPNNAQHAKHCEQRGDHSRQRQCRRHKQCAIANATDRDERDTNVLCAFLRRRLHIPSDSREHAPKMTSALLRKMEGKSSTDDRSPAPCVNMRLTVLGQTSHRVHNLGSQRLRHKKNNPRRVRQNARLALPVNL